MESIEQLKAMRDAARDRIEALPDYKLMTKLTTLIGELEEAFGSAEAPVSGTSDEAGEGESSDEEIDGRLATAEATEAAGSASAAGGLGEFLSGDLASDLTEEIAEGAAQVEIEETAVTSPEEEVSEEVAETPTTAAGRTDESALDAETALRQAMAEFEADLGKTKLESNAGRYRYGNST